MAGKSKRQLARERFRADIDNAIAVAAADEANRYSDHATAGKYLLEIMRHRNEIAHEVEKYLRRNWRISERARGATSL